MRRAFTRGSWAAAFQDAYEAACGTRPIEEVAVSPLRRYGLGSEETPTGITVYLSADAGPPERVLADMECHRAWMMLRPSGMDDCILDLPGLKLEARGDAEIITLSIGIADPKLVGELQRRAAHDLESTVELRREANP